MKYLMRLLVLPFWIISYLIVSLYLTIKGCFQMSSGFLIYGGEQITYTEELNKKTIISVYEKLEDIENNLMKNSNHCNHVWDLDKNSTNSYAKRCIICGQSQQNLNNNT